MSELMDAQRAVDIVTLAAELDRYKERRGRRRRGLPGQPHRGLAAPSGH